MYVKTPEKITLGWAVALIVIGVILGTVFTFGMEFWSSDVRREECTLVTAELLEYKVTSTRKQSRIKEIIIDCIDGEKYYIDGVTADAELADQLLKLEEGAELSLLLHPNSDTVLELTAGGVTVMKFDEAMARLANERSGFFFLGLFMYVVALVGAYNFIKIRRGKRRILQ